MAATARKKTLSLSKLVVGQCYAFRTLGEIRSGIVRSETSAGMITVDKSYWIADAGQWVDFCRTGKAVDAVSEGDNVLVNLAHCLACIPIPSV